MTASPPDRGRRPEVHFLDLAGAGVEESSTGPVLDDTARQQYERRIVELQEELDEADANHDLARTSRSQVELDALIEHLTAVGSGQPDPDDRPDHRAGPIRGDAPHPGHRQLDNVHPNLARHLRHAVNTGTYCSSRPEQPTVRRTS